MVAVFPLSRGSHASIITSILAFSVTVTQAYPAYNAVEDCQLSKRDELASCLAEAQITTSLPSSANWTIDSEAWNTRISPVPALVIFPDTEKDISAALKCAKASGTKVTTLGGNRSFQSQAFGRNDGSMIINMANMKVLSYDKSTTLLTYGGPVMISEAAIYMWNFKRALPHGRCPDVGMTGVAASGFGTLSRLSGSIVDNIAGARIALANGTIVDASETENSDLFWAIRGAYTSMGVIITFKIKTMVPPSQTVISYTIGFPKNMTNTQQDNVNAFLGTQAWALSADNTDLLSIRFSIHRKPTLEGFFYGSKKEWDVVSKKLLTRLPNMSITAEVETDFWASEDLATPGLAAKTITPRRFFYLTSITVPSSAPLTNATAWKLWSAVPFAVKPADVGSIGGSIDIWGGKYAAAVKPDASAWKHDDNLLLIRHDMRSKTSNISFSDASMQTIRSYFYDFVDAYKAEGGVPGGFSTYRDSELTAAELAVYLYGSNYPRLQKIKTLYDPTELFNTDPQSVPALKASK